MPDTLGGQHRARAARARPRGRAARHRHHRHGRRSTRCSARASTSPTARSVMLAARARSRPTTRSRCSTTPRRSSTRSTSRSTARCAPGCASTRSSPTPSACSSSSAPSRSRRSTPSPATAATRTRTSSPTASCAPATRPSSTSSTRSWATGRATTARSTSAASRQSQLDAYKQCREWLDDAIELVRPGVDDRPDRRGLADRRGARLPRRGGVLRPAVRPRPRRRPLRVADDQPPALARAPGRDRGGHGLRAGDLLRRPATAHSAARIEEEVVVTADGTEIITRSRPRSCWCAARSTCAAPTCWRDPRRGCRRRDGERTTVTREPRRARRRRRALPRALPPHAPHPPLRGRRSSRSSSRARCTARRTSASARRPAASAWRSALGDDDRVAGTYRGHGHALALGVEPAGAARRAARPRDRRLRRAAPAR